MTAIMKDSEAMLKAKVDFIFATMGNMSKFMNNYEVYRSVMKTIRKHLKDKDLLIAVLSDDRCFNNILFYISYCVGGISYNICHYGYEAKKYKQTYKHISTNYVPLPPNSLLGNTNNVLDKLKYIASLLLISIISSKLNLYYASGRLLISFVCTDSDVSKRLHEELSGKLMYDMYIPYFRRPLSERYADNWNKNRLFKDKVPIGIQWEFWEHQLID